MEKEKNIEQIAPETPSNIADSPADNTEKPSINSQEETSTTEKKEKKRISKKMLVAICLIVAIAVVAVASVIGAGYRVVSISATYEGETVAGTSLDKYNSGIVVVARTQNGKTHNVEIGDWNIVSPKTLEADSESRVIISYKKLSCDLRVACSDSAVASIVAYYDGKRDEGTVISNITDGFSVMAILKDNTSIDVTEKCTIAGGTVTLKTDKTSNIDVSYSDPLSGKTFTSSIPVVCSTRTVNQISAKYIGSASEGEILDENNSGIIVTAVFNNGDVEPVSGWTVDTPATLEASKIATICINYGEIQYKLTVECSIVDPQTYKKNCTSVSYNNLMRSPEKYENTLVKISGKVYHVDSVANTDSGYMYKIRVDGYKFINVAFNGEVDRVFIEDDYVICYGEFLGIDTSEYTETPIISAKYIDSRY